MGIHPEFSSFDRPSVHLDEARRTMWLWAEPIIIDRAVSAYARTVDATSTVAIARKHSRLWRVVIFDQADGVASAMGEVRRAAVAFGLSDDMVASVNDAILEELVDIVMNRYRASRNSAKAFSMVLMSATSCLGSLRSAA